MTESGGPDGSSDAGRAADRAARAASVQSFYGRWATLYDGLARFTPGIGRLRREAVAALDLDCGDTVVDLGCGTGANLPYLREAVGPEGTVVGVDLTRGMLDRARGLVDAAGWRNVHVVQGDATRPPVAGRVDGGDRVDEGVGGVDGGDRVDAGVGGVDGSDRVDDGLGGVDGVLASFVVGMLEDPAAAVADWCALAAPDAGRESDGHVVLVDAALSDRDVARPLNAAFRALTILSTPPTFKLRYDPSPHDVLRERVHAARDALRERAAATYHAEHLLGVVRVTGGRLSR